MIRKIIKSVYTSLHAKKDALFVVQNNQKILDIVYSKFYDSLSTLSKKHSSLVDCMVEASIDLRKKGVIEKVKKGISKEYKDTLNDQRKYEKDIIRTSKDDSPETTIIKNKRGIYGEDINVIKDPVQPQFISNSGFENLYSNIREGFIKMETAEIKSLDKLTDLNKEFLKWTKDYEETQRLFEDFKQILAETSNTTKLPFYKSFRYDLLSEEEKTLFHINVVQYDSIESLEKQITEFKKHYDTIITLVESSTNIADKLIMDDNKKTNLIKDSENKYDN